MMKLLIAIPIYEKHREHLGPIADRVEALIMPTQGDFLPEMGQIVPEQWEKWEKEIIIVINNSGPEFVSEVEQLCAEKGYKSLNLGDIWEERIMALRYKDGLEKDYRMVCRDNKGYIMAHVRNEILQLAINYKADYLLSIDADSVFEPDILVKLFQIQPFFGDRLGVLSPLPVKLDTRFEMPDHRKFFTPSIYFTPEHNPNGATRQWIYENLERLQYVTCDGVGFAFALIPDYIFKNFKFDPEISGSLAAQEGSYFSEDFGFCLQLVEKGFKIVVHTRTVCDYAETEGKKNGTGNGNTQGSE
jgi:cellulose synthase/poly-beta-1,6-N-acetylglucosamine synthase-like glycosyltransferase